MGKRNGRTMTDQRRLRAEEEKEEEEMTLRP